jgi:ferric-dicitrate binding protein FerR (iron transport regulator)
MADKDIFEIIGRILSGEASKDEKLELHRWMAKSKDNVNTFEQMKKVWEASYIHQKISNEDRVFSKIQNKKKFLERLKTETNTPRRHSTPVKRKGHFGWTAAAVISLMILISYPIYRNLVNVPEKANILPVLTHKENGRGQKSKVILSDGTNVWLNSSSKLSYINGFTDSIREVFLEGEAYFEVTKNKNKPFIVHTGKLKTTVIGTSFNIRHYPKDAHPTLFLEEGKVKYEYLKSTKGTNILTPGNGVKWDSKKGEMVKFTDDPLHWNAWKNNILLFDDLDFITALEECERWYDVDFIIKGTPPTHWRFTGKFKNAYLKTVLQSMQYGKQFDFKIQGQNIEITF